MNIAFHDCKAIWWFKQTTDQGLSAPVKIGVQLPNLLIGISLIQYLET